MKVENLDIRYSLYGSLFSLSNRIQTIGDKELKDITIKQHFLMIGLGMFQDPPTLKEMGDLIGCSYQNVKRMADHLQKEGYLKIMQDPNDKRKQLLVTSGKLEKRAENSMEVTIQFMEKLYKDIDEKDLEITLRTLKKMDRNIGGIIE